MYSPSPSMGEGQACPERAQRVERGEGEFRAAVLPGATDCLQSVPPFRRSGKSIVALTVQKILSEEIAKKLA